MPLELALKCDIHFSNISSAEVAVLEIGMNVLDLWSIKVGIVAPRFIGAEASASAGCSILWTHQGLTGGGVRGPWK